MRPTTCVLVLASLLLGGCATNSTTVPGRGTPIEREQIEAAHSVNVYDLVQSLRPTWLRTRGVQSFRESSQG